MYLRQMRIDFPEAAPEGYASDEAPAALLLEAAALIERRRVEMQRDGLLAVRRVLDAMQPERICSIPNHTF